MKTYNLFSILLFVCGLTLNAQSADQAKKLLDAVYQKADGYQNMQIDFRYILENQAENIKQEANGKAIIQKDKYLLELLGAIQLFDGQKLYVVNEEDEEVNISTPNDDDDALNPSKMMTFYQKGYNYAWDIEQNVSGRKIQYVKLYPRDPNSEVKYILMGVDKNTHHIYTIIQVLNNNTKVTLKVQSLKTDQPLSKNQFVFNKEKYKDFYINYLD